MGLTKINYVNNQTVITAENMNAIQDAIIALENKQSETPSSTSAVLYGEEQNLTDKQKAQAQKNIGVDNIIKNVSGNTDRLDDHEILISEINSITDDEITILNSLLESNLLPCNPVIEATVVYTPGTLEVTPYRWDVTATITGIDKSLIQKVEIGRAMKLNIVSYSFEEVSATQTDELAHICAKTYTEDYTTNYVFAVRLTYYDAFGVIRELILKGVEA